MSGNPNDNDTTTAPEPQFEPEDLSPRLTCAVCGKNTDLTSESTVGEIRKAGFKLVGEGIACPLCAKASSVHEPAPDLDGDRVPDQRSGRIDRGPSPDGVTDADLYGGQEVTLEDGFRVRLHAEVVEVPKPKVPRLDDVIEARAGAALASLRRKHEQDMAQAARDAESAVRRWIAGLVGAFSLSWFAYIAMAGYYGWAWWNVPVAPPAPSRGAVYDLLRGEREVRSDLWLVITADETDAARVEAAMAKDGGEK